jgi:hypothetical protein
MRAIAGDAVDRWTGASAPASSSPSSASPPAVRWIVVRSTEVASGIGPAIVERLTTGVGSAPIGRAAAGSDVGSPSPRRAGDEASVGRGAADDVSVVEGDGDAVGVEAFVDDADVASRLTVGIAVRLIVVLDGTRRMPPDGAGRGAAAAGAPSLEAGAAGCEWPAWLRWARGRTTEAAEVSGRSGTRIALRDTVGSDRTGAISGAATLVDAMSSSSPDVSPAASATLSAADLATTGIALLVEPADRDGLEAGEAATKAATGGAITSGSLASIALGTADVAAWRWAVRPARRDAGAGMDPEACSTARTRATTSPGVAIGLTSWPSCCTTGGRPWVPGSAPAKAPGAATRGIEPAVRWIGGRLAQARGRAGTAPEPLAADRLTVGEPAPELPPDAPSPELERRPRPNGRRTANQPSSEIRRLIFPISSTNRCRSGCSRSRIVSIGQWK